MQIAKSVGKDIGRIGTCLWKAAGSAEVQRGTTDTHLWQPNWLRDPVIDSEVARVEQLIRNKREM